MTFYSLYNAVQNYNTKKLCFSMNFDSLVKLRTIFRTQKPASQFKPNNFRPLFFVENGIKKNAANYLVVKKIFKL